MHNLVNVTQPENKPNSFSRCSNWHTWYEEFAGWEELGTGDTGKTE